MEASSEIKQLRREVDDLRAENACKDATIKRLRDELSDTEEELQETRYALVQTRDQLTAYEFDYK